MFNMPAQYEKEPVDVKLFKIFWIQKRTNSNVHMNVERPTH